MGSCYRMNDEKKDFINRLYLTTKACAECHTEGYTEPAEVFIEVLCRSGTKHILSQTEGNTN